MRDKGAKSMSEGKQRDKRPRAQREVVIEEHPVQQLRRMIDQLTDIERRLSIPQDEKKATLTLRYRVALELADQGHSRYLS